MTASLSLKEKRELLELLEERARREKYNQIRNYFPDNGPLRRGLYKKHMEFFKAGAIHKERLFMAGNRVGKSESGGGYEVTQHLTGSYPDWWEGKRFDQPNVWLAAGDTGTTTRDIIQAKLLGGLWGTDEFGTGLIPKSRLSVKPTIKRGLPDAYEEIRIEHESSGYKAEYSTLMLRSYEQGRKIFQGFELDGAWLDEEVPHDVYSEALTRTMTTNGIVIMTFTPLSGLTQLVKSFLSSKKEQEPIVV
ncbi:terminase large subunit domain-containing protein [Endozoicomonas arenosclerae]|uniref:terminase large subunit domain-containing protein n=1 Tax=Endozoicomonas arenosclerae TaxID=1633495 RepID=UPI000785888F|nr:terminase family protein [Endozoicomonas arenosclerae]